MIRYQLKCDRRHEFEAWFSSSAAYDRQAKRGQVSCPKCGSANVQKAMMAPSIAKRTKRRKSEKAPEAQPAQTQAPPPATADTHRLAAHGDLLGAMRKLRAEIEAKSEYVGQRFPEEARKIHYEETPARGIHGEATSDEARALIEEGIEFYPLPVLPEDQN
jgi:hypothetical protein